ncbi:MAG: TonB-dependent receptor [Pseudomonadota bacterium]
MLFRTAAIALLTTTALQSNTALAQSASASAGDGEVIVVTAQRREQNLLEVPISVSVVTGDMINKEGITSTAELEALVPSLDFGSGATRAYTRPLIRGIGDTINNGTDSNVGVYLDDVPLPTFLADFDLIDVERVEVLRGPQGTLFGQNSLAGAVNVITRKPSNEFEAALQLGYGSFEEFDAQAYVSGPLSDSVRVKLVANYNEFGGFVDNTATGGKVDPSESISLRGVLTYDVTDDLTINLIADYNDDEGSYLDFVPINEYDKFEPDGNFSNRDNFGVTAKVSYSGANYDITSITSYREFTNSDFISSAGIANTFMHDQNQLSQEVRLSSSFGDNFDWLLGLYYYDESFTQDQRNQFPPVLDLNLDAEIDTQTYAVFGDFTYAVTPKLDFVGGLRYTSVELEGGVDTDFFSDFFPGLFPPVSLAFSNPNDLKFEQVSARAALLYKLTDDISVFASYASGFKPGAFSLYSFQENDPSIDEETADSYEIALRGSLFDNKFDFDFTAFYVDYEGRFSLEDVPGTAGGVSRFAFQNPGNGVSKGIEAATGWQVTDNFRLTTSFVLLDTELQDYVVNEYDGTQDVLIDFSGNSFAQAPDFRATIGWDYTQAITDEIEGFFRGRWRYNDEFFAGDDNAEEIDSYNLTSLSVGVQNDRFTASVDVENVFDEYYVINATDFFVDTQGRLATPGRPQSFMARVRVRY